MDLDDLKDRYKTVPVWGRCVAALVLGTAPGLYFYSEEGALLDQSLSDVENKVRAAESALAQKMNEKAQIPKLEQTLAFTEDQLEKAKKSLPDSFDIDDLLQKVASIAREVGVTLRSFEPQATSTKTEGDVQFVELPVEIEMEGKFHQVATYLDRLAHLETAIFVRNLVLNRRMADTDQNSANVDAQVSPHDQAKSARREMKMNASFRMVLYRSGSDVNSAPAPGENSATPPPVAKNRPARSEPKL